MIRKVWYMILVLITIYLEIMYDSTWMLAMLAFELLLAAVMFLMSWYLKLHIRVWLDMKVPVSAKKQTFEMELHIKNSGLLPVSAVYTILECENRSGGCSEKRIVNESVAAKAEKTIKISAKADYCGKMVFSLKKVQVSDYLHLFARKVRVRSQINVNVLPDIHTFPVEVSMKTRNFPVEGDEYEKERSGDDPSEIFQIREFRPGDRMQQIHWKSSARSGELMTKEYSMPCGCKVLLLLEISQKEGGAKRADHFFELAASLCFSMLEAECPHFVAWYDEKEGQIRRHAVKKEQDLYEMLDLLMRTSFYKQEYDVKAAYFSSGRNLQHRSDSGQRRKSAKRRRRYRNIWRRGVEREPFRLCIGSVRYEKKKKRYRPLFAGKYLRKRKENGNIRISCDRSGLLYDPWCFRLDEDGSWNHKRCV